MPFNYRMYTESWFNSALLLVQMHFLVLFMLSQDFWKRCNPIWERSNEVDWSLLLDCRLLLQDSLQKLFLAFVAFSVRVHATNSEIPLVSHPHCRSQTKTCHVFPMEKCPILHKHEFNAAMLVKRKKGKFF